MPRKRTIINSFADEFIDNPFIHIPVELDYFIKTNMKKKKKHEEVVVIEMPENIFSRRDI